MIRSTLQEVLPVPRLPEPEPFHVGIIVAHRRVSVWRAMQVQIDEFLEIGANDLISVDENNLFQVHGEENVEEENFVRPDDSLLLLLSAEPGRPFVRH